MPKDIPGYYYDEDKNRYFPNNGPIPGSSSRKRKPENSAPQLLQDDVVRKSTTSCSKLLMSRELSGNIIPYWKGRLNFQMEYNNKLASQPLIWRYQETERRVVTAMEHLDICLNMPTGTIETNILLTGGSNGTISLFQIGKVGQEFLDEISCSADRVWPSSIRPQQECVSPRTIWRAPGVSVQMPSEVSCIKLRNLPVDDASRKDVIITTMGSGTSRGMVYLLDLSAPLEFSSPMICHPLAAFKNTIWTADICNRSQVVIGTNQGAFLVGAQTGVTSPILRCTSDVLSVQPDHSGNKILCGLRSGAIVLVDTRRKCEDFFSRNPNVPSRSKKKTSNAHSCSVYMPSSISCLKSLMHSDQYFVASSLDGSMKLYDQRLIQKGAVQSFEGNVNSHTHIQFGIDPSERYLVSGGEDCQHRLWNIRSGKLLFEGKFMSSPPLIVCWPKTEGLQRKQGVLEENWGHSENHGSGAWLGSREGLYYMDWLS